MARMKFLCDAERCIECNACVTACKDSDCDCIDRCYTGKPECRKLAAKVDACTTDVCAEVCK